MMREHAPSIYSEALRKAQRLKAMRLKMAKEQGTSD